MLRPMNLALLVLGLVPTLALADDAADRHSAAIALLAQMHTTDNMTQIVPGIMTQVRYAVTRGDPDLMRQFETFAPRLVSEAEDERQALVDQVADVYARSFTTDELKEMAAFYQTPLGQKIVGTQVQISGDIIQAVREWRARISQRLASEASVDLQSAKP